MINDNHITATGSILLNSNEPQLDIQSLNGTYTTQLFWKRLHSLYMYWQNNIQSIDCILICIGKSLEVDTTNNLSLYNTIQLLLLHHIYDDITILCCQQNITIVSNHYNIQHIKQLRLDHIQQSCQFIAVNLMEYNYSNISTIIHKLIQLIHISYNGHRIGKLSSAVFCGSRTELINGIIDAYKTKTNQLQVESIYDMICEWYTINDEYTLNWIGKSCIASVHIMQKSIRHIEHVVDSNIKITHCGITQSINQFINEYTVTNNKLYKKSIIPIVLSKTLLANDYNDVDLSLNVHSDNEYMCTQRGVIVIQLGMQYKHYHSYIARTLMINCHDSELTKYYLLLESTQLFLINKLPSLIGKPLCHIYEVVFDYIRSHNPLASSRLIHSIGYLIGIESIYTDYMIDRTNNKIFHGMSAIVLRLGLHDIPIDKQSFSLLIGDTILVTYDKCIIFTNGYRPTYNNISYILDDNVVIDQPIIPQTKQQHNNTRNHHKHQPPPIIDEPVVLCSSSTSSDASIEYGKSRSNKKQRNNKHRYKTHTKSIRTARTARSSTPHKEQSVYELDDSDQLDGFVVSDDVIESGATGEYMNEKKTRHKTSRIHKQRKHNRIVESEPSSNNESIAPSNATATVRKPYTRQQATRNIQQEYVKRQQLLHEKYHNELPENHNVYKQYIDNVGISGFSIDESIDCMAADYQLPDDYEHGRIYIEHSECCIILPFEHDNSYHPVVFHISVIRSVATAAHNQHTMQLQIYFNRSIDNTGYSVISKLVYIGMSSHIDAVAYALKSMINNYKRLKQFQSTQINSLPPPELITLNNGIMPPQLYRLLCKPPLTNKRTLVGKLATYYNGFNYTISNVVNENSFITIRFEYSNIKHIIYQPYMNTSTVMLHIEFYKPIQLPANCKLSTASYLQLYGRVITNDNIISDDDNENDSTYQLIHRTERCFSQFISSFHQLQITGKLHDSGKQLIIEVIQHTDENQNKLSFDGVC